VLGRAGAGKGCRPSRCWLELWAHRTGSTDAKLLVRTRAAVKDIEDDAPRSAELSTLTDARMRRSTHTDSLTSATHAGEVTYLDVFSCSKHDLPPSESGERSGYRYGVVFIDAYSRFKKVYFARSEKELPGLARHWLSELGNSVYAGGHFVLGPGCKRYMHTDGGASMNSEAFAKVLEEHGLAANVTSCPHTPSSNGVAERTFGTLTPDVRAALAMAKLSGRHWHHAFR
jgi:hypothetical protein